MIQSNTGPATIGKSLWDNAIFRCFLASAFIALALVVWSFYWQGHRGFNLWDEGFLWYGAQRVRAGDIPIRDFMAYDPGRYYWAAAWMSLWNDNGILSLRAAVGIFQFLGLMTGLILLFAPTRVNRGLWLIAAVVLWVWMYPRHKLFDITLSILLIAVLAFLVQRPSYLRYFLTGVGIGLAAVFGRNHAVYGVIAGVGTLFYLAMGNERGPGPLKGVVCALAGLAVGFLPTICMIIAVPGFAPRFWESIVFLLEKRSTNLPLPVPWPWLVNFRDMPFVDVLRGVLSGLFFVALLVFGVGGLIWVFWKRRQKQVLPPALVAATFLALPYAHFAFSRADIGHLAQGVFPFLIGSFILLGQRPSAVKWPLAAILVGASLFVMLPCHPGWQTRSAGNWVEANVRGSSLMMDAGSASDLALLGKLAQEFAPGDRSFLATPLWPGAYAALGRKAPGWEIYALFPRDPAFERTELERIQRAAPGFVIIYDLPLDGREELRFHNTHPLIDRYVRTHYQALTGYTLNPAYQIFRETRAP